MNYIEVTNSIHALTSWVMSQKYVGWDIYDGLNSKLVKKITYNKYFFEVLMIQLNKYSPINFRPLFKIKKGIDLKGIAIFAQAYSCLYKLTGNDLFENQLKYCLNFILNNSLEKYYGFPCWSSHYFPYTSIDKNKFEITSPDIIGTCESINALIDGYCIFREPYLLEYIKKSLDYLVKNFILDEGEIYIKYQLNSINKVVYNIYGKVLQSLSKSLNIIYDYNVFLICEKIINFLTTHQNRDGSWYYSINDNKIRKQYDFHQGYIIDGLLSNYQLNKNKDILTPLLRGVSFYKKMFLSDGKSYYRYPFLYPTDIHNQSQGIITFSKLFSIFNEYHYYKYAKKITRWTIMNMQDVNGYFYCQDLNLFKNKIPYMRWSQAWMLLSLSIFLGIVGNKNDNM